MYRQVVIDKMFGGDKQMYEKYKGPENTPAPPARVVINPNRADDALERLMKPTGKDWV